MSKKVTSVPYLMKYCVYYSEDLMYNPLTGLKNLWKLISRSEIKSIEQVRLSQKRGNKKMSIELKVNTNLKVSLDLTRDRVISNLLEARGQGKFKLDDRDFNTICNIVQGSFDQASQSVFRNADNLVKELKDVYGD